MWHLFLFKHFYCTAALQTGFFFLHVKNPILFFMFVWFTSCYFDLLV